MPYRPNTPCRRRNCQNRTEQLVRRLVEKVTVCDEKIAVKFKSGVEIDVDR